jgi:hypothetical protein
MTESGTACTFWPSRITLELTFAADKTGGKSLGLVLGRSWRSGCHVVCLGVVCWAGDLRFDLGGADTALELGEEWGWIRIHSLPSRLRADEPASHLILTDLKEVAHLAVIAGFSHPFAPGIFLTSTRN